MLQQIKSPKIKATEIARPIRVIIPGCLLFNSSTRPVRNGQPPKKKTIVERPSRIHKSPVNRQSTPRKSWIIGDKEIGRASCRESVQWRGGAGRGEQRNG